MSSLAVEAAVLAGLRVHRQELQPEGGEHWTGWHEVGRPPACLPRSGYYKCPECICWFGLAEWRGNQSVTIPCNTAKFRVLRVPPREIFVFLRNVSMKSIAHVALLQNSVGTL